MYGFPKYNIAVFNFGFFIFCVRYAEQERSPRDRDYFEYSRSDNERSRRGRSYDGSMESRLVLEILTIERVYLFNFPLFFIIKTIIALNGSSNKDFM